MRAVVQRVLRAAVWVDQQKIASIEHGLCVLVGVGREDTEIDADYLAEKITGMRIFNDEVGKMNRAISQVDGSVLLVSNFTLYGCVRKGRRPSFTLSADYAAGEKLYNYLISKLSERVPVQSGMYGADMKIDLVNDGPVTVLLDSSKTF